MIALMLLALYVAVNLSIGRGPRWYAIGAYWWTLTVKYIADIRAK